ncbi:hypothetical protein Clacol_005480 [Clathrus columnatus]|uniref:PX domain-containing protein n=1 Tax=Clathrus columnatus TaxID=1419009 RepID=A0AAV5AF26_9AGAM|nr:hypothetical protein Clacol_005480 [Clathrus columnatus]
MDDFSEDTNPFQTDVDDVIEHNVDVDDTVVPEFAELPPSSPSPPPPEELVQTPTSEPPAVPSKHTFPEVRSYNQLNGYRSPIDLYLHSGEDVELRITEAIKTSEHSNTTYIAYVIVTGNYEARRRYSEFESLRNGLVKLYPVLIIPPIPSKQTIGDYAVKQAKAKEDAAMISRRKRMLQTFLNRVARHPVLSQEIIFHKFLDGNVPWSEVLHSPPLSTLPKSILKAPAYNPTDTSNPAYNALPNTSAAQPLRHPDQRFLDSEAFTNKFASHLNGPMEKVSRRTLKRWSELSTDHADLGAILNASSLSESGHLATAMEKTGQAIDATYMSTVRLAQDFEQTWVEPLNEYTQFASIIRKLLAFRHQKHVQFEMTQDSIDSKKEQLADLEKSEREAQRLQSALTRKPLSQGSVLTDDRGEERENVQGRISSEHREPEDESHISSSSITASSSRRRGTGMGLLNALSYSLHGMMDVDPETARRNSITKTRESLAQLEDALRLSAQDLKYTSSTIQADLDRFQRQKVADLREMCINMARTHRDWCKKNLEAWEAVKREVENIEEHPNRPPPKEPEVPTSPNNGITEPSGSHESDGTPEKWPDKDKLDPTPVGGEVNYMRPVEYNEPGAVRWRAFIGREVAKLLGYEDFKDYTIQDFPEGYQFFCHYKGPKGDPRTDLYLYGSPAGRFRSSPEFIRHGYWLITDETLDRRNCKCKYCSSNKSQTEISRDLGLTPSDKTIRIPRSRSEDANRPKIRPVPRVQKQRGLFLNTDRVADLRATRRFRLGELVWTALSPPIEGEKKNERIEFWPALINEFNLKVDVNPHSADEPWTVNQHHTYGVRLLGVPHSDILPENSLLPYQAYGPSTDLIECLRMTGKPFLLLNKNNFIGFCPIPLGTTNHIGAEQLSFNNGATPFAYAIQIAAHLIRFWTPVQQYTFYGEVPSTSSQGTKASDGRSVSPLKENRCQGLWWGAERIWMDEVVRLQPSRAQVFAGGSNLIYPPSPRADGRGVLMRINSIISLSGETKDSPRTCKVAGVLYELAEDNYEEPPPPSDSDPTTPPSPIPPTLTAAPPSSVATPTASTPVPVSHLSNAALTISTPAPNATASPAPMSSTSQQPTTTIFPFAAEKPQLADPFEHKPITPALSHMPPYSLPEPPPGYKFRAITRPGYEIILDVAFIAGRYYSRLFDHSLLKESLDDPNTNESRINQLRALVGLVSGALNSMACVEWTATRSKMFQSADTTARQNLLKYWRDDITEMQTEQSQNTSGPSSSRADVDLSPMDISMDI